MCQCRGKTISEIGNLVNKSNHMNQIQTEGFRKEFTTRAAHGEGTYFSRDAKYDAKYAVKYAVPGVFSPNRMFQCKAMMGESCKGKSAYKSISWPRKSWPFN
eukprot:662095_1